MSLEPITLSAFIEQLLNPKIAILLQYNMMMRKGASSLVILFLEILLPHWIKNMQDNIKPYD